MLHFLTSEDLSCVLTILRIKKLSVLKLVLFQFYGDHRNLHSFPTRRSSDLNQAPARELFPAAQAKGYGIIARVPLASGLLTGKFRADSQFAADDVRQNFLTQRRLQEAVDRVDEAKAIIGGSARNLAEAEIGR